MQLRFTRGKAHTSNDVHALENYIYSGNKYRTKYWLVKQKDALH